MTMIEYHDIFSGDAENNYLHCLICCSENENSQTSAYINLTEDSITATVYQYVSGEAYSTKEMFTGEYIKSRSVNTKTGEILDYDSTSVYYTTSNLNIRSAANTSSEILEVLSAGSRVEVQTIEDGWAVIAYKESTAYVSAQYLTTESPESPAQTEAAESSESAAQTEAAAAETEKKEQMVWIPNSGTKYHSKSSCSNMKNPAQVTISEAKARGYEACKKCW